MRFNISKIEGIEVDDLLHFDKIEDISTTVIAHSIEVEGFPYYDAPIDQEKYNSDTIYTVLANVVVADQEGEDRGKHQLFVFNDVELYKASKSSVAPLNERSTLFFPNENWVHRALGEESSRVRAYAANGFGDAVNDIYRKLDERVWNHFFSVVIEGELR